MKLSKMPPTFSLSLWLLYGEWAAVGKSGHKETNTWWVNQVGDHSGLDGGAHAGNTFSTSVQEMKMTFEIHKSGIDGM